MIHVTGLYRDMPDSKFDFNWEAAPFICITHVEFPTIEDFRRGLERHGEELFADVPNYTNIEPEIQFSEIVNSRD
jgi:hypothetical protein